MISEIKYENRILAVDDHITTRHLYSRYLKDQYHLTLASSAGEALKFARARRYDLYITDLIMPGMDGIQFIRKLRKIHPDAPVIVVSQTEEIDLAVGAFRENPLDFLRKPIRKKLLLSVVKKSLETSRLKEKIKDLHYESGRDSNCPEPVLGSGDKMKEFWEKVRRTAESELVSAVMITGESGTGKEIAARYIHQNSIRKTHPFVAVNCGLLTPQLAAGELMGIEKGVATGVDPRRGKFQVADRGTIFLDEIAELPGEVQSMLLRVLQERVIMPVGSHEEIPVDVRVVAATNKNLKKRVEVGLFREDLFYRLSTLQLETIPLRHHPEDIPEFLDHLYRRHGGTGGVSLSDKELKTWMVYTWPGNIRQLENVLITRIVTNQEVNLDSTAAVSTQPDGNLTEMIFSGTTWPEIKKQVFKEALDRCGGNVREAAKHLGIPKSTLWEYYKKNGIIS